jgi:hypothetical protein
MLKAFTNSNFCEICVTGRKMSWHVEDKHKNSINFSSTEMTYKRMTN